ncbi:DNA recombination protein RmuC [bacterium]|nr:DNA recombination protein RmuC [bacterium]|tara:strand:+ start:529 stop:1812 length:1284 start_codon:yes stop_codon:yes gene_type:complete
MEIVLLLISVVILLLLLFQLFRKKEETTDPIPEFRQLIQHEFNQNREELAKNFRENRIEFTQSIERLNEALGKKAKEDREELRNTLKDFQEAFSKNVHAFNELQKQNFASMGLKQDELVKSTELKLEKMRQTVDEKLHKTLEERLGKSFEVVTQQLLRVQKGLGEMQTLASGVGDLKKVLSNVKTSGVLGEIQLGNILEQVLAPEQYAANVKTKKGSDALVEFAIKMPGRNTEEGAVYLPIDAKFPQEDYLRLQTAYENGDVLAIETSLRDLLNTIKKFARDISQKYIDPPHTTDFGIMFLPFEGLYAEVTRHPALIALLQREYKIIITGPTTLAAMLNSLQMGFKTLAIQKRSSEVWEILASVKKEFSTFGEVLEKAQKKINEADQELNKLVTTRTKMMLSKLRKVEQIESIKPDEIDEEDLLKLD